MPAVQLLDARGDPIPERIASEEISAPSVTSIRQPLTGSIATGLTPSRLALLLQAIKDGDPEEYLVLAEEQLERDGHLRSLIQTRTLAVAGLPFRVEAASDDPADVELADLVRADIVEQPEFRELISDLTDGIFKGYSVVEIIWNTDDPGEWVPRDYKWRDPRHFAWDRDRYEELRLKTDKEPVIGEPLQPGKFICHAPDLKTGHVFRRGLAITTAPLHMFKGFTLKDWLARSEVFGQPWRIGKYADGASPADVAKLRAALRAIGSDAAVAIPDSMVIDILQQKTDGDEEFQRVLVDWLNKEMSKLVLGTNMVDEQGGSFAKAQTLNTVRKDIRDADARSIQKTVNQQLVRAFVDVNLGPQDAYPRFAFDLEDQDDLEVFGELVERLNIAGVRMSQREIRDRAGFTEPDDDEEVTIGPVAGTRGVGLSGQSSAPADA